MIISEACGNIQESWKSTTLELHHQDQQKDGKTKKTNHHSSASASLLMTNMIPPRLVRFFKTTFLPAGYPQSVTSDYAKYQLYDSLQALCSTVVGTLSTRAVLKGVGVGDATATAMSGTVSWLLRDGAGMVGRIAFASVISSDLDHDAKRWRLAADVTNDIGLFLNILSEHVPREYFIYLACVSSLFFAVTGVAGGATRSALTRHFSVSGFSVADISACEGSQETAINFIGMFLGMAVAVFVPESFVATLCVVAFFTFLHLLTNYLGVTTLILEYLNENRLVICLEKYLSAASLPTPDEMRSLENVVLANKRLVKGGIHIASSSLRDAITEATTSSSSSSSSEELTKQAIKELEENNGFCIIEVKDKDKYFVILEESDDENEQMKRIIRGYLRCVSMNLSSYNNHNSTTIEEKNNSPLDFLVLVSELTAKPDIFLTALKSRGWRVDRFQLRVGDWRVIKKGNKNSGGGESKKEK